MAIITLSKLWCLSGAHKALLHPSLHRISLLPQHTYHTMSPARLFGKQMFSLHFYLNVRMKTAEAYCQTIASCRNARKNLLQCMQKAIRRTYKVNLKGRRIAWSGISLGMSFLAPSVTHDTHKPLPVISTQPTTRRKKKAWWSQFLDSVYEFISVCLRALRLILTFVPILMLYPVTYFGRTATDAWWAVLLTAIEFSGPILIKLGQWASTRKDLFPDSCCSQFSRLQRRNKPHSWHFTKQMMKMAFGPNWRKIFVKFDNDGNPIGSGCVAQVYKVWMSAEAIPDDEVLQEILSEMEDAEEMEFMEGLEVIGLKQLFGLGLGLLGLKRKTDTENLLALEEYHQLRHERKSITMEEKQQKLMETEAQQESVEDAQESSPPSEVEEVSMAGNERKELEDVKADVSCCEAEGDDAQARQEEDDAPTHLLLEEWQEGELDKSLPVCDAPLEDLEGLVPVAVKVLHPGIAAALRRDLRILKACASIITTLIPPLRWLSLPQCVQEFAEIMVAQVNLKTEADNLEKFSDNFSDIPYIKFPRPLRPYVTTKILVETFEEGEPLLEVMKETEDSDTSLLRKRLAEIGVDALLKMVFVDNLVHGDLHPGNLMVQNITSGTTSGDQVKIMMVDIGCDTFVMDVQPDPNPLRICFLDCGITSRLTQQNLAKIRAVFKQVVLGDGESVADLFLEHSEHQCADPQAFREEVNTLVQAARESTVSLSQVDVGVLLQQVLGVLLRHKVRLESAFSSVVLAIFVLEGLGRALDPDMDILERARPVLVTNALP